MTSKQSGSEISVPPVSSFELPKGPVSNTGMDAMASMSNSGMDLKTMMAARMQGLNVPAYGASSNAAQGLMGAQGMMGSQGMMGNQGMLGCKGSMYLRMVHQVMPLKV